MDHRILRGNGCAPDVAEPRSRIRYAGSVDIRLVSDGRLSWPSELATVRAETGQRLSTIFRALRSSPGV